jgi:hypothetical protein
MGYKILNSVDRMREKYTARAGLEGPFNFNGRVLYYDVREGAYYDPTTDFYLDQDEMDLVEQRIMDTLSQ